MAQAFLARIGVTQIRLLTNNPAKTEGLCAAGVSVAAEVALRGAVTADNTTYLSTKRERMGHTLAPLTNPHETEYA